LAARHPDAIAAAVVAYPVTDLVDLAQRSHRFEAHYNDSLVGTLPDAAARFDERAPIRHPERFTRRPILLMHGDADPVVPVDHSRAFTAACAAAGGDIELVVYEGEGHGFRRPENQMDEYRRMHAFLGRTVGPR
jgi:dipeptidyl aminopeptidase/acylaminoacyl peptidase